MTQDRPNPHGWGGRCAVICLPASQFTYALMAPAKSNGRLFSEPQNDSHDGHNGSHDGAYYLTVSKDGIVASEPERIGRQRHDQNDDPDHEQDNAHGPLFHLRHLPLGLVKGPALAEAPDWFE